MIGIKKGFPSFFSLLAVLLAFASHHPLASQVTESVDPFYENLLEEGRFFYQEGKTAEVIENLEVAYFGFLDSPARLAECYIYLTVCHFQQKNLEKAKYYHNEIKRLKLEQQMAAAKLPDNLAKKYAEVAAKLGKS
jgi:hypothetical protein